ncbi:ANTAR domain-containing protein [Saccharopolyspora aridisoli]|uniref:ANTAR domain-containing protein n=1 Tax=Saccharopolyspora aridisoli TaxID=2530385 RepID=A0A4R4UNK4_9PSEU|nr:GAF and ANTAR domain-containing protein [Saccharopolyspora aridisoli]TDC93441.1 ANTAR domain-containing protein [Saccharopolyspora aridisoli]
MAQGRRRQLEAALVAHGSSVDVDAVCALCVSHLSVSGAGATVLTRIGEASGDGLRRGLVHATNEISSGLEDLQLTVGEGPCLDAFASGGPVLISDLAAETTRWPGFSPGALKLGAAALFSFPLEVGVVRLGSLDLYRDVPGPLSGELLSDALILADLVTQAIVHELDGHAIEDLSWLDDPHAEVHQASGMLQVQLDSSTEVALLRLRSYAYTHELPITEVARQVVSRKLRFRPDDDPTSSAGM